MKVNLMRSYRSKNGNATFVYKVAGNTADIEAFKAAQGDYYREDDNGSPLWFTTRCIGAIGKLLITTNGNVVPDMSAFDQAASLANQYGGNFGQELAKAAAAGLVAGMSANTGITPAVKQEEEVSDEADSDIGDL